MHHHHTCHERQVSHRSFNTAFAIAVTLTLIYTLGEVCCGIWVHSMSLLADAAHNLGDCLGLMLAWGANWLLSFPARRRYSYGFKRMTIMAALANACILIATSAIIAYEAIDKLFHLTPIDARVIVIVACIGVLINGSSSLLFRQGVQDDLNIRAAFWHLLADTIILCGVICSALSIWYTGWYWLDPVIGLVIVGMVVWGTWGLLRDSVHLMLDAIPRYIDYTGVKHYLSQYPGVKALHDLHIWGLSTREVALTVHLVMEDQSAPLTAKDYAAINLCLHKQFHVSHVTIQLELDDVAHACPRRIQC